MFANNVTVGLDRGVAGNGCPFARVVDEADVDCSVLLEIVGLARLSIGVEKKVKAVSLL